MPATEIANPRLLAVTYSDTQFGADAIRRLARQLHVQGARCVGFVEQAATLAPPLSRCNMVLEDVASGERITISEDRGPLARGCRLDGCALADVLVRAEQALAGAPDVLIVNKFGKSEAEGTGFRALIGDAVALGIAVVIAVPWRNIEAWRLFAGGTAREVAVERVAPGMEAHLLAELGWLQGEMVMTAGLIAQQPGMALPGPDNKSLVP
jgi:hypothetical protein